MFDLRPLFTVLCEIHNYAKYNKGVRTVLDGQILIFSYSLQLQSTLMYSVAQHWYRS